MKDRRQVLERIESSSATGVLNMDDTWVSRKHRYFYMGIPKTACSKVKMVLQQLEGFPLPVNPMRVHWRNEPGIAFVPSLRDFSRDEVAEVLTSPDWFRFSFVRNPYTRLFSAYRQKVMDLGSPYNGFRESVRAMAGYPTPTGSAPGMVAFRDFVRYVARQEDRERDGHWRSQAGTLCLDAIEYDFIGRVESFEEGFTSVLRRFNAPERLVASVSEVVGATVRVPDAVAYDAEFAEHVYGIYRKDFETFGYHMDSWRFAV